MRQIALASMAALAGHGHAALITMDFANNAGLGLGVGTTQTISQNGIQMSAISGSYEVTDNPQHELNLKDFTGSDPARSVEFTLLSGLKFDFVGLSFQDGFGDVVITSSRGGSTTFSPFTVPGGAAFSGAVWKDIDWIRVTTSEQLGEAKFNAFTFDDVPTFSGGNVPEPSTLALVALGIVAAWRGRRAHPAP